MGQVFGSLERQPQKMLGLRVSSLIFSTFLLDYALADVINLASLNWTLTNANGTINVPSVGPPSQAHLDLLNAGIITDPLLGINGVYGSRSCIHRY
jgi:beta-mannosidase